MTIPPRGTKREAELFVAGQLSWIERQRRRIENARATPRADALPSDAARAARQRARVELPQRLRELAARHGLRVSAISIRNQRSRWGSCSPTGRICLNWRLVLMPEWVRDYVIVHELMHLRRLDHSARFWKLVADACPHYQRAREWLRRAQWSE